jgi:hypothetical protein
MDVSRRNVQRYVSRLKTLTWQTEQEKADGIETTPFLIVKERYRTDHGQLSNLYDFSGLTAATVKLAIAKGLVKPVDDEGNPLDKNVLPPLDKNVTPPATNVSTEEEISKNTHNKNKYTPRNSKAKKEETDGVNQTYSHIAQTAIGNGNTRENSQGHTRNNSLEQDNGMHQTNGSSEQSNIEQSKQQGNGRKQANGFTSAAEIIGIPQDHWQVLDAQNRGERINEVEFVTSYIEDFSRDLGDDFEKIPSNITRAVNIYHEWGQQDLMFFRKKMQQAKGEALGATRIKKRNSQGGINRMPWFFTDLRDLLGLPAHKSH